MLFSVCRSTDSDPLITSSFGGPHLLSLLLWGVGLAPLSSVNSISPSSAKGGYGVDVGDGGVDVGVGDGGVGVGDGGGVSSSGLKSSSKGLFKSKSSIP